MLPGVFGLVMRLRSLPTSWLDMGSRVELHLKLTHLEEPEYGSSVLGFSSFCLLGFLRRAVFEAVAIVAGFNDVAVMSQPVE